MHGSHRGFQLVSRAKLLDIVQIGVSAARDVVQIVVQRDTSRHRVILHSFPKEAFLSDEVGVAILELPAIEDIAGGTIHQAAHARRAARQHFMKTRPGSGLEDKRLSHGQEEEDHHQQLLKVGPHVRPESSKNPSTRIFEEVPKRSGPEEIITTLHVRASANRADRMILRLLNLGGWFSTGAGSLGIARVPDPAGYSMCGSRRTQRLLPSIPRAAARHHLAVGAIAALRVRRAVVMICGAQRIA